MRMVRRERRARICWKKLESAADCKLFGRFLLAAELNEIVQTLQRGDSAAPARKTQVSRIRWCMARARRESCPARKVWERTKRRTESLLRSSIFRDCGVADHNARDTYISRLWSSTTRAIDALHHPLCWLAKRMLIHSAFLYSYFCEYSIPVCYHHTAQGRHCAISAAQRLRGQRTAVLQALRPAAVKGAPPTTLDNKPANNVTL